jgi:hypothetical protein
MECYYCHQPNGKGEAELRPYGPSGAYVCYGCVFHSGIPERVTEAQKQLNAALDAAHTKSNVVVFTPDGPMPVVNKKELD